MIRTQFTLYMTNRPGELARATKAFAAAEINIDGISVAETTDVGLVQLIVSDAGLARQVLKKADISFSEQRVAILTLPKKDRKNWAWIYRSYRPLRHRTMQR